MIEFPVRPPPDNQDFDGSGKRGRRYYFDNRINSLVVFVSEGDFYVSTSPYEVLSTVLGSCIAVCIWDPIAGCGGMNHFLLPTQTSPSDGLPSSELRFGSYSIERLVNALIARGAVRERLEVKIFGGANIADTQSNYGHANADFVEQYLKRERLTVVASSLRGTNARRVRYHAASGRARVSMIGGDRAMQLIADEAQLATRVTVPGLSRRVEIFEPGPRSRG